MKKVREVAFEALPVRIRKAASALNEGAIIFVYHDGPALRMETERGVNPYVWRGGNWQPMLLPEISVSCL